MFKIVIWGAIPITYFLFQFDFIYHLNSLDLVAGLNIFTSINLLNFYPTIIQCSHTSVHLSCGPSSHPHSTLPTQHSTCGITNTSTLLLPAPPSIPPAPPHQALLLVHLQGPPVSSPPHPTSTSEHSPAAESPEDSASAFLGPAATRPPLCHLNPHPLFSFLCS